MSSPAKIMKYETIDAKYTILTKQVKLQHEKKPVSNLLSMSVCLQRTFMKFIEFSFRKNKNINCFAEYMILEWL